MSWELQPFEASPNIVYPIEVASLIAGVPRREIIVFCKYNLLSPVGDSKEYGYCFDGTAIRLLRRIQRLRSVCGDDFAGIGIILKLSAALEQLRSEIAALKRKKQDYLI